MPAVGEMLPVSEWNDWKSQVQEQIRQRTQRIRNETTQQQRQQLKDTLQRVQGDFGRRRRAYRAALLRNPPSIPLWGVMSLHPQDIAFATWTEQTIRAVIPAPLLARCTISDDDRQRTITCSSHADITSVLRFVPGNEASVVPVQHARLVAVTANSVIWFL